MFSMLSRRLRQEATCVVDRQCRFRPNRDVFSAVQDGTTVLLDLRKQVYLGIDEVGTVIWQGIERGASRLEIELDIAREYDIEEAVAHQDTGLFLTELLNRGLLVRA